jgi:hypothetical protein
VTAKGEGKCYQWLQDHLEYDGDYCLIWPFYRNPNGYGMLGHNGEHYWAHRLMCELVHGPAPTPDHEAAHACGNGAIGCAHPKHLSWKTRSENLLDCREHGTHARNIHGNHGRLTYEQVQQIRDLKGKKTQAEIAAIFGIHEPSVRDIFLGRTYARERKIKLYTPEEEAMMQEAIEQGRNFTEIARMVGRKPHAISSWAYRRGLRSGQPCERKAS